MLRQTFASFLLLVLIAAVHAANPDIGRKDYGKVARDAVWTSSDKKVSAQACFDEHLKGHRFELLPERTFPQTVVIRILKEGKEAWSFTTHPEGVFTRSGDTLYVSEFHPIATGCSVSAYSVSTGKQLWKKQLTGLGPIAHSKYRNQVNIETDGTAVTIWGKEAGSRYVEILDGKTGKMVGHKVFKAE